MRKTLRQDVEDSPIPSTVDKFWEAWFFLIGSTREYHDPWAFRYNLNAFIQALRNITFMLQSEPEKPAAFSTWYAQQQEYLRQDPDLHKFVESGGPGESHPRAPTDPYVTVSRHTVQNLNYLRTHTNVFSAD